MFVLSRLWGALGALAGHVEALAATVAAINGELRRRAGLEAPANLPAIDHAPAARSDQTPVIGHDPARPPGNGRGGRRRRAEG